MKKNIAYYLEDPERLSEISLHELNKWVEEMPYSQPLRLLVNMKSEKFVSTANENNTSYGAYFVEDYEPLTKKATKELAKLNIKKIKNEDRVVASVSSVEDSILEEKLVAKGAETEEAETADDLQADDLNNEAGEVIVTPIIEHNLVDDVSEDILEEDLLETNPNVVLVNEVSHETADEILEDEVENEVLEVILGNVEEVASFSEVDSLLESKETVEDVGGDNYEGLVDYKSFVVGVSDENENVEKDIEESDAIELLTTEDIDDVQKEDLVGVSKKVKKKSKNKDKETAEVDQKKKASKKKRKKEKKKSKDKDSKKTKAKSKQKDKSKKSKSSKKKISSIKKVKGKILKTDSSTSTKSVKSKAKKAKKEVKYVVVNEATTNDFKLKNYDGVSKYTNWLLEQKSINGVTQIENKKSETLAGKKKDKKKKKKKKAKVLKVAQDSVKKSEMILSEPLANIMAAQGHIKKASKMYKQLGLIFPEKSSYFAAKIENLKKK